MFPPTITFEQLPSQLEKMERRAADLSPLTRSVSIYAVNSVKDRMSRGITPSGSPYRKLQHARVRGGDMPLLDTGQLRASWQASSTRTSATASTNLDRAPIHQTGGKITPKKAKYLAIPATKQALRTGSPRRFAGELRPKMGRRGGVLVSVDSRGNETVQYYLVPSVYIPERQLAGWSQKDILIISDMTFDYMLN